MEKLFIKFIGFIRNPLSSFFFYLTCVSIFLFVPPEGFGVIAFVFMLPFVFLVVVGLNLPLFSTLFSRFTMSDSKKKNHALEHGTIYFIKQRYGDNFRVGGQAEKSGFRICGVSKKKDIIDAFEKLNEEFIKNNKDLYLSLKCGSNIVTSQAFGMISLSIAALAFSLLKVSGFILSLVLVGNVLLYFILRKNLGNWVQEKFFMSTEFVNARIHSINKVKKRRYFEINPVYFVKTIIK